MKLVSVILCDCNKNVNIYRGGVYGRYDRKDRELVPSSFIPPADFEQSNHFDILGDSVVDNAHIFMQIYLKLFNNILNSGYVPD